MESKQSFVYHSSRSSEKKSLVYLVIFIFPGLGLLFVIGSAHVNATFLDPPAHNNVARLRVTDDDI